MMMLRLLARNDPLILQSGALIKIIAANTSVRSLVIAVATPVIYLARQDKEGKRKRSSDDGKLDDRQQLVQAGTRGTVESGQRSVAEILNENLAELAKLRDAVN